MEVLKNVKNIVQIQYSGVKGVVWVLSEIVVILTWPTLHAINIDEFSVGTNSEEFDWITNKDIRTE